MSDQALWVIIIVLCVSAMGIAQVGAEQLDDPTRPSNVAKPLASTNRLGNRVSWELNAIKIDKDRRIAIVNGRTVKEGDRINNARLVEILPTQIKLKAEKGIFFVKLVRQKVKMPLLARDTK